ncbi:MAG: choice-of-anchor P family protein [Gemmatimonadaceae bacterium]
MRYATKYSPLLATLSLAAACGGDTTGPTSSATPSAHITAAATCYPRTYSGNAFVLKSNVLGVVTNAVNTGPLPACGGLIQRSLAVVDRRPLFYGTVGTAETRGSIDAATSKSSVLTATILVSGQVITADVIGSTSKATSYAFCLGRPPKVSGSTNLANVVVNGTAVTITGAPNQKVPLGLVGSVTFNEQIKVNTAKYGAITVNAVHVRVTGVADVIVASSHSDIACT